MSLFRRHKHPRTTASRQLAELRINKVKVPCGRSGPEMLDFAGRPYRLCTLADVEAWVADLRRFGAGDDLVLGDAEGLVVTLEIRT